jgi:hypothetical protein
MQGISETRIKSSSLQFLGLREGYGGENEKG